MNTKSILLSALAAMLLATPAAAGPNGWYVGLEGGASWVQDVDSVHTRNAGATNFFNTSSFDTGWAVFATVGFEWTQWRFEGELGYRQNNMDRLWSTGGFTSTSLGNFNELSLMGNMLYDFSLGDAFSLSVGMGVGVDHSRFRWAGFGTPGGLDEDDWSFAAQGILGLNYLLADDWDAFVNYRYMWVDGPTFSIPNNTFPFDDLSKHAVTAGVRWRFSPTF